MKDVKSVVQKDLGIPARLQHLILLGMILGEIKLEFHTFGFRNFLYGHLSDDTCFEWNKYYPIVVVSERPLLNDKKLEPSDAPSSEVKLVISSSPKEKNPLNRVYIKVE